ncbi:MAG: hypothetical protein JWN84_1172 [Nocardioides sp.]|nr:hypothetical protein [Nocardioides sp.]
MKTSSRARRTALASCAALLTITLAACGSESDSEESAEDPAPTSATSDAGDTSASGEAGALPEWAPVIETEGDLVTGLDFTDTPEPTGELQIATVTEGDGPPVEVGQEITANYFGSVYGSDTPFDESFSGSPFTAPIGVGSLIQGWDEEIPGTPVGSRIIMSIPPDLGYGDQDNGPIPGGSTLFFVIDIIEAA